MAQVCNLTQSLRRVSVSERKLLLYSGQAELSGTMLVYMVVQSKAAAHCVEEIRSLLSTYQGLVVNQAATGEIQKAHYRLQGMLSVCKQSMLAATVQLRRSNLHVEA